MGREFSRQAQLRSRYSLLCSVTWIGSTPASDDIWHMPLIWVLYHGEVGIDPWEWLLGVVYLMVLYIYFARMKNVRLKAHPEYKHLLWGLFAKVIGGVGFSLIYFYYYRGGDTISYFYSAVAMSKLAITDPLSYLSVLFGPNDREHLNLFSGLGVQPIGYMYFDPHSFAVIRLISPLVLIAFNSYVITTLLLASICYIGIWRCYRTFVGYFPTLTNQLAIAFLYMPSLVFWGSGVMKDTFTLTAAFWWIHCFDELFFKKRHYGFNVVGLLVAASLMIAMKPYIFMVLMPLSVLWLSYFRVAKLRNALLRVIVLPLLLLVMIGGSVLVFDALGDKLGKFGLEEALHTTVVIQEDMKRSEQYGDNYFDIGTIEGTWTSVLTKFPLAVNAALFRPYLWESKNVVMLLSGLENLWLLGFTLLLLWRTRVWFFVRCITGNPMVLFCMLFTVSFAFIVGISTPNFGALVRFKIPLLPLFVSGLFIIEHLNKKRFYARNRQKRFELSDYLWGEPRSPVTAKPPLGRLAHEMLGSHDR